MLVHPDKNPTMTDRASLAFEGIDDLIFFFCNNKFSVFLSSN